MIKLVAVDLDGTFLNSKREVSKENRDIVKRLQERGIQFITNSGRTYDGTRAVIDQTDIICDSICMNGASVYDKDGNLIRSYFMKEEDVKNIVSEIDLGEYFIEFNTDAGTCINVSQEKAEDFIRESISLYNNWNGSVVEEEEILRDIKRLKGKFISVLDVNEIFERGYQVFKVVISHRDTKKIEALRNQLSQNTNIAVSASFATNIEITDRSADKGLALEQYAKEHGIKMEEVVAFGDSLNDYSMLKREFGYTVAMKNAIEPIQEIARYQTLTNDEHGVADFIKKIIF